MQPDNAALTKQLNEQVRGQICDDGDGYYVEYVGTDGKDHVMGLEAETYDDALFEAVALLCD